MSVAGSSMLIKAAPVVLLVASVTLATGERALAQCEIDVEGTAFDVRDHRSWSDPIEIDGDDTVTIARPGSGLIAVAIWFGPLPVPLPTFGDEGDTVSGDTGDLSRVAVGLYRVDVAGPGAGECTGTFWVRVAGPFPLVTAAGAASLVAGVAGLALVTNAMRRGRRQRCSVVRGVVGGVLAGGGLAALLQQFAVLPMLIPVIIVAVLVPGLIGGLVARRACVHPAVEMTLTPLLAAPLVVAAGRQFELRLGVAVGSPGARRAAETHELTAHLVAAAASVEPGERWRHELAVRSGEVRSDTTVLMRAGRDLGEAHLTVLYSSGGQTIGVARRPLWVVDPEAATPPVPSVSEHGATVTAPFRLPVSQVPVDLELRATHAGPRALHVLQWTAESPHRDRVALPDAPVTVDLGSAPEAFAASLLLDVTESGGGAGLAELLLGAARQLARTMGTAMLAVVRDTLDLVGPGARVLIITEEASVPWDLVAVESDDWAEAPFLATRAVVGRWFLAPGTDTLPPPVESDAQAARTVIATDVLPAATTEARRLEADFGFVRAPATVSGVLDALEQSGIVHLACHGSWRFEQSRHVLELSDGRVSPRHVAGLRLGRHPFVFLNACQVASGGEALGTPTGFPAELVFAGAGACVSPVWSVDDQQAHAAAIAFYNAALTGLPPAEAIRAQRHRAAAAGLTSVTAFAYQYVGHPDLVIATGAERRVA